MIPTNEEIEKVFKLTKKYSQIEVYNQQRINLFDYIRKYWNS